MAVQMEGRTLVHALRMSDKGKPARLHNRRLQVEQLEDRNLLSISTGAPSAPLPLPSSPGYVAGQVMVEFQSGVGETDRDALRAAYAAQLLEKSESIEICLLSPAQVYAKQRGAIAA